MCNPTQVVLALIRLKDKLMKKAIFFISLLGVIIFVWNQTINWSKGQVVVSQRKQKSCGKPIEGLRPCVLAPDVCVSSGEDVVVNVSLENLTDKVVTLGNGRVNSYEISVTNVKGQKLLSLIEELKKKVDEGKIPLDDLIKALPINSSSGSTPLEPKEELKLEFNISQTYDLKLPGKYFVQIVRKIPRLDEKGDTELSFSPIEVEVK
jgi:hypothetical protein